MQENVWRRREAHEECLDVRSVGEDLHGERAVRGEQLQLIVHRPLRRIGLRQVIDCTEKKLGGQRDGEGTRSQTREGRSLPLPTVQLAWLLLLAGSNSTHTSIAPASPLPSPRTRTLQRVATVGIRKDTTVSLALPAPAGQPEPRL